MTITVGLMSDPGLPMQFAQSLATGATQTTTAEGQEWEFCPASEKLPLDENGEIPLARFANEIRDRHEWDYAIYITELPIWREGQPVMFEITRRERSALVSLPALGVFRLRHRLGKVIAGLAQTMIEGEADSTFAHALRTPLHHASEEHHGNDFVLVSGKLGRMQLLTGMIRTNRPGRLIGALSSSVATAVATGTFGVFYASIWSLADALHPFRLVGIAALVIAAFGSWLISHNGLWNTPGQVTDRSRRWRDNAATLATIGLSVAMMYLLLFLALFISGLIIIDAGFLASELGHSAGVTNYLRLAALAAALGMMAGAVGSNFDRPESIREATYSRREVERRKLADEFENEREE